MPHLNYPLINMLLAALCWIVGATFNLNRLNENGRWQFIGSIPARWALGRKLNQKDEHEQNLISSCCLYPTGWCWIKWKLKWDDYIPTDYDEDDHVDDDGYDDALQLIYLRSFVNFLCNKMCKLSLVDSLWTEISFRARLRGSRFVSNEISAT